AADAPDLRRATAAQGVSEDRAPRRRLARGDAHGDEAPSRQIRARQMSLLRQLWTGLRRRRNVQSGRPDAAGGTGNRPPDAAPKLGRAPNHVDNNTGRAKGVAFV